MKTEKLQFYVVGADLTNKVRELIGSGKFNSAYKIFKEQKVSDEIIKKFFLLEAKFIGDTRKKEGILLLECKKEGNPSEFLFQAIKTVLTENDTNFYQFNKDIVEDYNIDEFKMLFSIISFEEIINLIYIEALHEEGFWPIIRKGVAPLHGVILANGMIICCNYMGHKDLYPLLYNFGLASADDWMEDNKCVQISSYQLNGHIAANIKSDNYIVYENALPTNKQLQTLFECRKDLSFYGGVGENISIASGLRTYVEKTYNNGGKYNNLMFLKTFYPKIKLPKFNKEIFESKNGKIYLRTSPKQSMPGLLNSKLLVKNNLKELIHESFHIKQKIHVEFKKYNHIHDYESIGGKKGNSNELHFFYQEFIDGLNGVAHYNDDNEFTYQMSYETGAVVKGKKEKVKLIDTIYKKLKNIAYTLYKDLKTPIQLEFVVSNDILYIVQLRLLENNYDKTVIIEKPKNTIVNGKTFSKGNIDVNVKDILIVESEAKSEELIGKKALIVQSDVEFSHILALSKQMEIPSMFSTGKVNLSKYKKVKFTAYNKESWITKLK